MKRCHYCNIESDDLVEELMRSCTGHDVTVWMCQDITNCLNRTYEQYFKWQRQNEINRRQMGYCEEVK